MKICAKCKAEKELSEFSIQRHTQMSGKIKAALASYCKQCTKKSLARTALKKKMLKGMK